jgi:hypothetical protein
MAKPSIDNQDTAYNDAIYWYKTIFRVCCLNIRHCHLNIYGYFRLIKCKGI